MLEHAPFKCVALKYQTSLKMFFTDKHSSLLYQYVSKDEKSFIALTPVSSLFNLGANP
jgi:hypothetical protein